MKTFLKVLLVILAAVVAIRLLPLAVGVTCGLAALALLILVAGASAAAVVFVVAVALAAVLSPLWVPALAIVGAIRLMRHRRVVAA